MPDPTDPIAPTIHLNGTAGGVLFHQYKVAASAVDDAIAAVCEAGPNSRDYYVQGPDAPLQAQREHEARIKALRKVRDELAAVWEKVAEQQHEIELARRPRRGPACPECMNGAGKADPAGQGTP